MRNDPVFIEVPTRSLSFGERLRASARTVGVFLRDQSAVSLGLLVIYALLLVWDFQMANFSDIPSRGGIQDKLAQWFPFMDSFYAAEWKLQAATTWRGTIAQLLLSLYGFNALIYMADRSPAFADRDVVGIVRFFFRSLGILLLMLVPAAIGVALLVVPGLIMLTIFVAAGTITVFKDQSPMAAIHSSFRLLRDGLGDRPRIWGFRPVFFHIMGIYLIDTLFIVFFTFVNFGIHSLASRWQAEFTMPLLQSSLIVTGLILFIFGLLAEIFVLRIFAESLPPRHESTSGTL
ncbi:hypothetical protein [Oligoflexus tunisiensis]|uniref:hypothetical protein n=1 Tax=Oligoflexus tunisiensis TaxID=708132 RepID=UPI00114D3BC5|nr:hypothetical protein [Oligoflexus tunisiensis]